jgi:hypothetical protein
MKSKDKKSKSKGKFIPTSVGIPGLFGGGKMRSKKEEEPEVEIKKKK